MLIAIPQAGLANRIQLLASAHRIAQGLSMPFAFYWPLHRGCGCGFGDLFERQFTEVDETQLRAAQPATVYSDTENPKRGQPGEFSLLKVANRIPRSHQLPNIIVESCGIVAFDGEPIKGGGGDQPDWFRREMAAFYRALRPIPEIRQRIEAFAAEWITPSTVGVHIRRTDNARARQLSTDDRFMIAMEEVIETEACTNFLLATDCPRTERLFQDRFGDRVCVYPKRGPREVTGLKALDRGTREGVQDALIDLLLLAGTRRVLGSCGSSYSIAPQYFSGRLDQVTLVK